MIFESLRLQVMFTIKLSFQRYTPASDVKTPGIPLPMSPLSSFLRVVDSNHWLWRQMSHALIETVTATHRQARTCVDNGSRELYLLNGEGERRADAGCLPTALFIHRASINNFPILPLRLKMHRIYQTGIRIAKSVVNSLTTSPVMINRWLVSSNLNREAKSSSRACFGGKQTIQ